VDNPVPKFREFGDIIVASSNDCDVAEVMRNFIFK
jgi:hypothetical protein